MHMGRTFPLHTHVLALALGLVLLVGGLLAVIGQHLARDMMASVAQDLSLRINREVRGNLHLLLRPADMALRLLQEDELAEAGTLDERLRRLPAMRAVLTGSTALSSVYVGYGDGQFFFVRRLASDAERARFAAPADAAFLVQSIDRDGGVMRGRYLYFDKGLALLAESERPTYPRDFDPRYRDWFRHAPQAGQLSVTPPYLFFSDREVGVTLARRVAGQDVVVGADIRLHTLGEDLMRQRVTPGTRLALVDEHGRVMAQDDTSLMVTRPGPDDAPGLPTLGDLAHPAFAGQDKLVAAALAAPEGHLVRSFAADGENWLLSAAVLQLDESAAQLIVTAIPERELMALAHRQRDAALMVTALVLLIAVPLTWALARQIARPLRVLATEAEAIRRFNFGQVGVPRSRIREVAVLGDTMDGMRLTIRRFLELNTVVAGEPDFDSLLPRLLGETLSATRAQGGVLYLAADGHLAPAVTLDGEGRPLPETAPWAATDAEAGQPGQARAQGRSMVAARALGSVGPLMTAALAASAPRAAALTTHDLEALGLQAQATALGVSHAIAVPLLNRQDELVGAMLLLLDAPADDDRLAFIGALSGLAAVTLEARALIAAQKALFEALVRMVAGAIDAKSQHTGGHCARVPELARLLAQAACDARSGPYAGFSLDEGGWETLRIAAWLHDCGKITTPEYVVEKATKLHALYDRIHEVRMRFEVLKREAELRCLQDIIAGAEAAERRRRCDAELAVLDEEFAFVARCNQGVEAMAEADVARLHRIAGRTWTRTLDDRLGVSGEELARKPAEGEVALPCAEPVLADRAEHRVPRRPEDRFEEGNPWGFRMQAPHWQLDLGELHNLGVCYGTLTDEERYLINAHIIRTEIMLRQLPWPRHLVEVPEVAASHHEKMDGSGYPKGLDGTQMSLPARMIAVADIFEALTARDRPYKAGKTLSEALAIMARMAREGHVDPGLFALFLRSGSHLVYARRFMTEAQIDAVDIDALLAGFPAT